MSHRCTPTTRMDLTGTYKVCTECGTTLDLTLPEILSVDAVITLTDGTTHRLSGLRSQYMSVEFVYDQDHELTNYSTFLVAPGRRLRRIDLQFMNPDTPSVLKIVADDDV